MSYKKVRALPKLKQILADNPQIKQVDISNGTGLTTMCIWKIVNRQGGSPKTAKLISEYLGYNQALLFEVVS